MSEIGSIKRNSGTGGGEGRKEIRSEAQTGPGWGKRCGGPFPATQPDPISGETPQVPGGALKRFLLMLSDRIFDSSVDRAIPSLAAAPDGPNIRPWDSRRASSIISLSVAATFSERNGVCPDLVSSGRWDSQLSSTVKVSVSHTMTDRSMTFCSSRMFPGQGYDWSNCRVFLSTLRIFLPALRA